MRTLITSRVWITPPLLCVVIGASATSASQQAGSPPKQDPDTVNLWIVDNPRSGPAPTAQLPADIAAMAQAANVVIDVRVIPADEFATVFLPAFDRGTPPDIVSIGNDFLVSNPRYPGGIAAREDVGRTLVAVSESLSSLQEGWQYLVTTSPNHASAEALIMAPLACDAELINDADDLLTADRELLASMASSVARDYLSCRVTSQAGVSDNHRLGSGCATPGRAFSVDDVMACGTFGNANLAFIPVITSVSTDSGFWAHGRPVIGQKTVLSVMRRTSGQWRVLTITDDPHSVRLVPGPAASLFRRLRETRPTAAEVQPAVLVTEDGEYPVPEPGQRFGDFVWRPSTGDGVVAEIAEFQAEWSTRLFLTVPVEDSLVRAELVTTEGNERKLSSGSLRESSGHWRIWSIRADGSLVLSEHRSFGRWRQRR